MATLAVVVLTLHLLMVAVAHTDAVPDQVVMVVSDVDNHAECTDQPHDGSTTQGDTYEAL